jgi:hypothetical protein
MWALTKMLIVLVKFRFLIGLYLNTYSTLKILFMVLVLEIPEYEEREGIKIHWEYGFEIFTSGSDNEISILANKAGLTSLAIQLLTLAQDNVPTGSHIHYDKHNSLESGSKEFIIGKK